MYGGLKTQPFVPYMNLPCAANLSIVKKTQSLVIDVLTHESFQGCGDNAVLRRINSFVFESLFSRILGGKMLNGNVDEFNRLLRHS